MSVIEKLIRLEDDGTLSFGNHLLDSKKKVMDFEVSGDLYYVKTYNEITKCEKNSKLLLETVPGATIHNLKMD
ncbi:MAG: endosialidase, partial [Lachnospiraceae bacterium]|nr:endosialidase [Lachnospiraceae bacterium]